MKISDQVCSLEQAKKLQELGVTVKGIYDWTVYCPDPIGEKYYYIVMDDNHPYAEHAELLAPAFTVAELGIMLPLLMKFMLLNILVLYRLQIIKNTLLKNYFGTGKGKL